MHKETRTAKLRGELLKIDLEIITLGVSVLRAVDNSKKLTAEIEEVRGMTDHEVYMKYGSNDRMERYYDHSIDGNGNDVLTEREPTQAELFQESCNTCW